MKIKGREGSAVVGFMLLVPAAVALIVATLAIGMAAFERAKLQAAADMAAYAGSASLADSMNKIAVRNKNIYDAFVSFKKDYGDDSQQNAAAAEQRYTQYKNEVQKNADEIKEVIAEMDDRAVSVALRNFSLNSDASASASVAGGVFVEKGQESDVMYSNIVGSQFIDPESYDGKKISAIENLIKQGSFPPTLVLYAEKKIQLPFAEKIVPSLNVSGAASASAFGGNIEKYARGEVFLGSGAETGDGLYWFALSNVFK
jgi:hypothetical protein